VVVGETESAGINRHEGEDERALLRKGVASREGPESCAGSREGAGEALTGVRVGWLLSREITSLGCRRRGFRWKAIFPAALARVVGGPCAVGEPVHAWNLYAREPGDPMLARCCDRVAGRSGKTEVVRLG
jgi:hypothetical protein